MVSLSLTIDSVVRDCSDWVVRHSISAERVLCRDDLKANTNSARLYLDSACPWIPDILATSEPIEATLTDPANARVGTITGYLTDSYSQAISSTGGRELELQIEDPGVRLLRAAWVSANGLSTSFFGCTICAPSSPSTSFVHILAGLAGVSLASSLPTIAKSLYFSVADDDRKEYWTVLDAVLWEFGYIWDLNDAGELYIASYDPGSNPVATGTASTATNIARPGDGGSGIETRRVVQRYDGVTVEWEEYRQEEEYLIFRDTTGNSELSDCKIDIAAGAWFPEPAGADTWAQIEYSDSVYGKPIVYADDVVPDIIVDQDIEYEYENLGPRGRIRFHNTGATTQSIRRLRLIGTAWIVKSQNKTTSTESGKKIHNFSAAYVVAAGDAAYLANVLQQHYALAKYRYQFRCLSEFAKGELVALKDPLWTGLDVLVRIVVKRSSDLEKYWTYEALGIGAFSTGGATARVAIVSASDAAAAAATAAAAAAAAEAGAKAYGYGINQLPYSDFPGSGDKGWTISTGNGGVVDSHGKNKDASHGLLGNVDAANSRSLNVKWIRSLTAGGESGRIYYGSDPIPCEAGKKYIASVFAGAVRCQIEVTIQFFDSSNAHLSDAPYISAAVNNEEAGGGTSLADYKRIYSIGVAPASAASCKILLVKAGTKVGETDSLVYLARAMIEETNPGAYLPGAWTIGPSAAVDAGGRSSLRELVIEDVTPGSNVAREQRFASPGLTTNSASYLRMAEMQFAASGQVTVWAETSGSSTAAEGYIKIDRYDSYGSYVSTVMESLHTGYGKDTHGENTDINKGDWLYVYIKSSSTYYEIGLEDIAIKIAEKVGILAFLGA